MDVIFKKPKLGQANKQAGNPNSRLSGISCSLYPALKAIPSSTEIENFKSNLQEINGKFGVSLYMTAGMKMVPTKVGPAPLGGYLSYQLAPTEGNFEVRCNVDFSRGRSDNDLPLTTYPHFPLALVLPLFTITQCPREHQEFLESLQLNENDATSLEKDTVSQRSSNRWWKERRPSITASQFGDILVRKSVTKLFLERLVNDCSPNSTNNLPEPLKHGIEHESAALQQYTNYMKHNGHPVKTFTSGFIVNPSYPFLGCSPDGKVIDETEDSPYGILEIKCPYKHRNVTPQTACSGDSQFHLGMIDDFPVVKKTHKYYKQVQGQMGISGAKWCDLITYTFKGMVIERIYFDTDFFADMLLKLEEFFFKHFAKYFKCKTTPACNVMSTCTVTASTSTVSGTSSG